jgi:cysteine desulfurase/selenocysteine lyase
VVDKSRFPRAQEVAYLDTAAEGLPPVEAAEALAAYYADKAAGTPGRRRLYQEEQQVRCAVASLLGASHENVALLGSASDGLNLLANSIDWRAGDEILIHDLEFPSNVLAWLRLRSRGVKVRVVPSVNGVVGFDRFAAYIGPATRLVSVSAVSYKTGTFLHCLASLAREAHRAGAIFCVDATQALGRVPLVLEGVDYLVASSYKWLLGVHGVGVVYLAPELCERLAPAAAGWYGVREIFTPHRFERFEYKSGAARLVAGMPNFPAIYALRRSVELLLSIGVERLCHELSPLVAALRRRLADLRVQMLTPASEEYASGIVSFAHPDAERIGAALEQEGVIVWAGDGRVRLSVHLYNDAADVDRAVRALSARL